jgi:hypothetical protein
MDTVAPATAVGGVVPVHANAHAPVTVPFRENVAAEAGVGDGLVGVAFVPLQATSVTSSAAPPRANAFIKSSTGAAAGISTPLLKRPGTFTWIGLQDQSNGA